jgi:hypothetical protein
MVVPRTRSLKIRCLVERESSGPSARAGELRWGRLERSDPTDRRTSADCSNISLWSPLFNFDHRQE